MGGERIGVYGGTFDPLHIGHFRIAEALVEAFGFDRLFFVPASVPPHKRGVEISSPHHRYAMIALATQNSPRLFVSPIELEAPARPYTIETLARLEGRYPGADLFFVMGADSFAEVNIWRDYEQLLREYRIVVAMREGQEERTDLAAHLTPDLHAQVIDLRGQKRPREGDFGTPHIFLTDFVLEDVSATQIRKAVADRETIDHLVPRDVSSYIAKYRLYQ